MRPALFQQDLCKSEFTKSSSYSVLLLGPHALRIFMKSNRTPSLLSVGSEGVELVSWAHVVGSLLAVSSLLISVALFHHETTPGGEKSKCCSKISSSDPME